MPSTPDGKTVMKAGRWLGRPIQEQDKSFSRHSNPEQIDDAAISIIVLAATLHPTFGPVSNDGLKTTKAARRRP